MGNSTFALPLDINMVRSLKSILPDAIFYDFFGENVFRADMCNADVKLGDLLIHEGSARKMRRNSPAKVFHADKTYFVLNGTSAKRIKW